MERESKRGQLFSGHTKEEGAALVTLHVSVNMADTPSPFKRDRSHHEVSIAAIPSGFCRQLARSNVLEVEQMLPSSVDSFRNAAGLYWCQFW